MNLQTFQFIQTHFPNIQTLELTHPNRFVEEEDEHHRALNEDLLSNLSLQLPSITKLCFLLRLQSDHYRIFRRFLHLLPNLVYLQMYIDQILFREILAHEHDDDSVKGALTKIKLLQMVRFYDEKNKLSDEETHWLFPNAQILFDYDEL